MKFCVVGAPLAFNIAFDAKHSDSFKSIFEKVQVAAGKATPLDAYDLYTTELSSLTGELVAVAGPLCSTDTPATLHLDSTQSDPHVLMLVRKGVGKERGSMQNVSSRTMTVARDPGSESSITTASTSPTPMATPRATDEYRRRVRAMYLKYNPGQIDKVEVVLDRYRGCEEDALQQLVKRYGPEPAPGEFDLAPATVVEATSIAAVRKSPPLQRSSACKADIVEKTSYYHRLVAIYSTYRPEKLSKVKGTLRRYAGREEEVIRQLVMKYGPEPSAERVTEAKASVAAAEELASPSGVALQQSMASVSDAEAPVHAGAQLPVVEEPLFLSSLAASKSDEAAASRVRAIATAVSSACGDSAEEPKPSNSERKPLPTAASPLADPLPHHTASSPAIAPSNKASSAESMAIGGRHRESREALCQAYNPVKLHTVQGTVEKLADEVMTSIQQLVECSEAGPAPLTPGEACKLLTAAGTDGVSCTSPSTTPATTNVPESAASSMGNSKPASPVEQPREAPNHLRQRIVAMIAAHEPDKLDRVDRILEMYRNREEEVIAKLEMRYAPHRGENIAGEPKARHADASAETGSSWAAVSTTPASAALLPIPHFPSPSTVPVRSTVAVAATPRAVRVEAALAAAAGVAHAQQSNTSHGRAPLLTAHRVAATHLESAVQMSLRERYWATWRAHYVHKRVAALLQQELWVKISGGAADLFRLNDSVEPAYTVSNLAVIVTQEEGGGGGGSQGRAFSSELQIALRALLASLRHCVESRVVEAQSSEELQMAEAIVRHWSSQENLCPVTDSPELAHALQQSAHLIGQLGDLITVIRAQAGQLQRLKALHRGAVEHMDHTHANTDALEKLQAQLKAANKHRRALEQELHRISGARAESHAGRPPSRRVRAASEERKDAQIAQLQRELAKTRNSLFLSKKAEEKMKVQLQQCHAREVRQKHEGRHCLSNSARYSTPRPAYAQPRSQSAGVGDGAHMSLSSSPRWRHTRASTPRGLFSYAISQETPRGRSTSLMKVDGRVISSIRKPGAATAEQNRTNTSIDGSTPRPSSRNVVASKEVELGSCPNCFTPLTSCCGEEIGPASERAAFCFSCRRYFTFGALRTRSARKVVEQL
ncbi:hypothetical protein LSCM4_00140 [Leishmania orientalis]|uniref:Uncharacterized protein n=1 Tax=Leishmania orientalis TaxID=2249476 RepID=A0A836G222_9TRYP|nr:hypothetical protein LSCM4_00140 [Leishmania orientalis]